MTVKNTSTQINGVALSLALVWHSITRMTYPITTRCGKYIVVFNVHNRDSYVTAAHSWMNINMSYVLQKSNWPYQYTINIHCELILLLCSHINRSCGPLNHGKLTSIKNNLMHCHVTSYWSKNKLGNEVHVLPFWDVWSDGDLRLSIPHCIRHQNFARIRQAVDNVGSSENCDLNWL